MPIFNSIGTFVKRMWGDTQLDPVRDWLMLLTVSAIALAGIIVWNVWAFDTVANGGIIGTANVGVPSVFNRSSLNEINAVFANRAAEELKYETGVYSFADPSQ